MFSFIMHGGYFPIAFDRYKDIDLSKKDIFDTHQPRDNHYFTNKKINFPKIKYAIDRKLNHVKKINSVAFAGKSILAAYEKLPFKSCSFNKIFYYTPHGLKNHNSAILEAKRVLKASGTMLILIYDINIESAFICKKLSTKFKNVIQKYLTQLDGGRYDEITRLARSPQDWCNYFQAKNFTIKKTYSGLSTIAWKIYDVQTRPILPLLIRIFNLLPDQARTFFKIIWMLIWYPILLFMYIFFANEHCKPFSKNCYIVFELKKND